MLTYDEVRQLTIKPLSGQQGSNMDTVSFNFVDGQDKLKHPKLWLPPKLCLDKLCTLAECMITYLLRMKKHDADLPDFSNTCLTMKGNTWQYDLGSESCVGKLEELLLIPEQELKDKFKSQILKKHF